MLKFKSVTMRNFLSMGNVTQAVKLDDHGLTLVLGNNVDSNGGSVTKNGAGKSSILQAISYCLYGWPLSKIKIDNLINNINQKSMLVTLDFEFDGKDYRIERGRKPNILKFFVNGEEIEDMTRGENKETQLDISSLIGMSHTMFSHIIALNTNTTPFLRLRAAEQREVSEELLGVTQISTRAESLKKLINVTKDSLRQEDANINATQQANSRIHRAIEQANTQKSKWDSDHSAMVAELDAQIDGLQNIDFDAEKAAFDALDAWKLHQRDLQSNLQAKISDLARVNADATRLQRDVLKYTNIDVSSYKTTNIRLNKEKDRKKDEIERITSTIVDSEKKLVKLVSQISNPGQHECITCAQPLIGTDHLVVVMKNLDQQLDKETRAVTRMKSTISTLAEEIDVLDSEIFVSNNERTTVLIESKNRIDEINKELKPILDDAEKIKAVISDMKDRMTSDDEMPVCFFVSRDEMYATKHLLDSCVQELERERIKENPHLQHLTSLHETLQDVSFEEINRLQDLLKHQDFLFKLLTNKDSFVRKKIVDQNLYYLNTRVNFYLDKLGLPHEVVFQNDLTTEITILGRDLDFEQLSRGEMNRVIMAVSWSFRDVWESLNHTVNLMMADEVIDSGIDGQGSEAALGILKSFGRNNKNVFLISHREELVGRIDRTMLVSKENGFTTITME